MAATIDRISGGRLDLGIGAGWLQEEFDAFGFPFGTVSERFGTLEETLAALSALQSGGPATYDGPRSRSASHARAATLHGRVPVLVGGKGGPRLLRLAASTPTGGTRCGASTPTTTRIA